MVFRRFTFQVTLRVALILGSVLIFAAIFGDERLLFNQIIVFTIMILQILELVRYVNLTNRELTKFIEAIRQSDFTQNFNKKGLGRSYEGLFYAMQDVIEAYKKVKIEREAQYHLLETVMQHVPAGIIVISENSLISNMNESARKILGIPEIHSWKLLENRIPDFTTKVDITFPGNQLIDFISNGTARSLSLNVSHFELLEKNMTLLTFLDIKSELEQKEVEAWHRLIRILTHEIMNSVTPISSMAETVEMILSNYKEKEMPMDIKEDISFSVGTIQKRSEGLLQFVEDYRKLTRTPKPDLNSENLSLVIDDISRLMKKDLDENHITLESKVAADVEIIFDRKQIEQVLINLIKNSREAISESSNKGRIVFSYEHSDGVQSIILEDNGPGIPEDILSDVWVPFYTTKEKGSGIGLSLSKQIMKLHNGDLKLETDSKTYTRFILEFQKG